MLARKSKQVLAKRGHAAQQAEAQRLWKGWRGLTRREVDDVLRGMANGVERCMYCEDSAGMAIDHFFPKADYPEWAFDWGNHLLACARCNSFKRDQFPLDRRGYPLLIDPSIEDPAQYIEYDPKTGLWCAIDGNSVGKASIRVFGLGLRAKRGELEKGRKQAWSIAQSLILDYGQLMQQGDSANAQEKLRNIHELHFSGVVAALVRMAKDPKQRTSLVERKLLRREVAELLDEYPEIGRPFC